MKKTALVTGGAIRIGRAIVEALAESGYRVIIHYGHSETPAKELSQWMTEQQYEHCCVQCDLSSPESTDQLFSLLPESFRSPDVLVNSAAVFPEGDDWQHLPTHWQSIMNINAYAPLSLSRQFALQNQGGHIINILDARLNRPMGDHFVYRMAKGVLHDATLNLARELAPDIQVNALALGAILPPPGKPQSHLERLKESIPLNRVGDLSMVQSSVLYLLSQPFLTGQIIKLDGGEFL
ncbi:SDR family oxidoreductase [Pleionea sp. CnH1-48]|uniref:SDR family oxidoreductase n=1 Tax=Pleionea sp. CnH1-48 TaxID=2954494 RepID=UPI0020977E5F|nr:SDR family oxidoreductase [Pleionea sp. CnH1-48]MCO7225619.1 SDR family oxidoreductase [Pleionea sp. CnH1-48]